MKGKVFKSIGLTSLVILGIVSILGTGGGGGGGGVVVDDGSYTGVTTQAQITEDNAVVLAVGAFNGLTTGVAIDILGAVKADNEFSKNPFSLGLMPFIFEDIANNIKFKPLTTGVYLGAVPINDTMTGACNDDGTVDGSAIIDGSVDDTTGEFTMTVSFNDYCEYEGGGAIVINGQATLSGTIDLSTIENEFPEFYNYTFTFTSLTLEDFETGNSITINGSFSANYAVTPMLITMSFILKDNTTMQTYWFRDVQIGITGAENYVDITSMTGRYYEPVSGYVEISLGDMVRIYDADNWPASGSMNLTGAENTKALLAFVDAIQFEVEADTDGDGTYDFTYGPYSWVDWPDGGGSSGDCANVAGEWTLDVYNIASDNCPPEDPWQSTVNIFQDNCTLETSGIKDTTVFVPGIVDGNDVIIGPGIFEEDFGFTTSTFAMTLDTSGAIMSGKETWTWVSTDGTLSCTGGTADITATKSPSP